MTSFLHTVLHIFMMAGGLFKYMYFVFLKLRRLIGLRRETKDLVTHVTGKLTLQ